MDRTHPSPPNERRLVIWAMTDGKAGMRSQARGLAGAIGGDVVDKTVDLRSPWSWLPGHLVPGALKGLTRDSDVIGPPWPDVLVTCGRRPTAVSIAIKRLAGPKVTTVHIQHPLCRRDAFDLIAAMRHDRISGPNVVVSDTAMHHITAVRLEEAAVAWRPRLAHLPRPLIGVLIGGSNRAYRFTPERTQSLVDGLRALRSHFGAGLAITPSRRTDPEVVERVRQTFGNDPGAMVWDFQGDNPYLGILALSDRIVVTNESISMISEALATPHPVEVFALEGEGRRHGAFVDGLIERRLVTMFDPAHQTAGSRAPINATPTVAARVRDLVRRRSGVSV